MAERLRNVELRRPIGESYSNSGMSTVKHQHRTSTPLSSIAPSPLASIAEYEEETAVCGGSMYYLSIYNFDYIGEGLG